MIFEEKSFSRYIPLIDQISLSGLPLIREILANMFVAIVYQPGCDASVFKLILFLIKPFFLHDLKDYKYKQLFHYY